MCTILVLVIGSLVGFHPVTLQQAVHKSSTIVIARRAKVDPARPIKKSDSPFTVVETLQGRLKAGALIYVAPGYEFLHEQIGEQIAKQNGSYQNIPSPIEDAYKSSVSDAAFAKAKELILFLGCDEEKLRCELSVVNGYESTKKRPEVEAAMKMPPNAVDNP